MFKINNINTKGERYVLSNIGGSHLEGDTNNLEKFSTPIYDGDQAETQLKFTCSKLAK